MEHPSRLPGGSRDRKADSRLHGKGNSELPWRKGGQPSHLVDVVDSDQQVADKELSLPRVQRHATRTRAENQNTSS